jgi:adenylate kinase
VVAKLNLVLLGPPASGKGTQATLLSEALGIPAVSTGVIIRGEMARGTLLGQKAKGYLSEGQLLPDRETLQIVSSWFGEFGCEGFIFDGFPRTVPQAREFDRMLSDCGHELHAAVHLDAPRRLLEKRILGRLQCVDCGRVYLEGSAGGPTEGDSCPACRGAVRRRDDDNLETFALRYREYEEKTAGLVRYYAERQILKSIDGQGSPANVFRDILAALGLASVDPSPGS